MYGSVDEKSSVAKFGSKGKGRDLGRGGKGKIGEGKSGTTARIPDFVCMFQRHRIFIRDGGSLVWNAGVCGTSAGPVCVAA